MYYIKMHQLEILAEVAVPVAIRRLTLNDSNVCFSFFGGGPADIVTVSIRNSI